MVESINDEDYWLRGNGPSDVACILKAVEPMVDACEVEGGGTEEVRGVYILFQVPEYDAFWFSGEGSFGEDMEPEPFTEEVFGLHEALVKDECYWDVKGARGAYKP